MNNSTVPANQTSTTFLPFQATPSPYSCGLDLRRGELPLMLLISLVVNSISVAVLWRMRGTCDSVDHLLISILNLNDLLTTAIFLMSWIAGWSTCGDILLVDGVCSVVGWLGSALVVWSAFIILIMAYCRYLSLVKPLYYRRRVDGTVVVKISIGAFVGCLVLFLFPLTGAPRPYVLYTQNLICAVDYAPGGYNRWHRAFVGLIGTLGVCTVIFVTVCNLMIVKTLSTRNLVHTSSIHAITAITAPATTAPSSTNNLTSTSSSPLSKRRIFQRVTLIVCLVYVMCYGPFVIRLVVDTAYDLDHQDDLVHSVTLILLFMSPLLNPFVYGLFNKSFRVTLISMFRCRPKT